MNQDVLALYIRHISDFIPDMPDTFAIKIISVSSGDCSVWPYIVEIKRRYVRREHNTAKNMDVGEWNRTGKMCGATGV